MDMLLRVLGWQLWSGLLAISDSLTVSLSGSVPVKPHLDGIHGSDNLIWYTQKKNFLEAMLIEEAEQWSEKNKIQWQVTYFVPYHDKQVRFLSRWWYITTYISVIEIYTCLGQNV